jgi:endonuclease/exonuclease/phosphatase family metal-dependent hydrolase
LKRVVLLACLVAFSVQAETLKVTTWNLDWLTARGHKEANLPADVHVRAPGDFAVLAGYARKLAADVVAFQEVDGPDAAALVFDPAQYRIITTDQKVVQRVGLAVRRNILVLRNEDYAALDVSAGGVFPLRDGLDATLKLPGGARLRVLVVHLKSGCQTEMLERTRREQCALLARQVAPLAAWAAAREADGQAFLILGDFNRVMDEAEPLGAALEAAAPMARVTEGFANPCWQGDAFIDHIFAGGAAKEWVLPGSLRVQIFREPESYKQRLSDHCPVSVKLRVP